MRVFPNFNEAYHSILKELIQHGKLVHPRGQACYEIINYGFTIEDSNDVKVTYAGLPERQPVYEKYRHDEYEWYMSGNLRADSAPSKFWLKIADANGLITSNYGYMVLHDEKIPAEDGMITSLEYVIKTLSKDPDSRQAIVHYGEPHHFRDGNRDCPCTSTQQFFIRNNKLECITTMRSNDAWIGLPYDISWFCDVMGMVASPLGVGRGRYHHNVGSMHLYERNLEDARKEISRCP